MAVLPGLCLIVLLFLGRGPIGGALVLAATEGPDEADCDLVAVGGTFRIQCVATCATTTNYSYSLVKPDGEVLTRETREFELRVSGGSDGGTYICYCSWSDGDVGGRSDGERHCVLVEPMIKNFTSNSPEDNFVRIGNELVDLSCTVESFPVVPQDSLYLTDPSGGKIKNCNYDEGNGKLTVECALGEATLDMVGSNTYHCVSENRHVSSSDLEIVVYELPELKCATTNSTISQRQLSSGTHTASLQCIVSTRSPRTDLKAKWEFEGQDLKLTDKHVFDKSGQPIGDNLKIFVFTVCNFSAQDDGEYVVRFGFPGPPSSNELTYSVWIQIEELDTGQGCTCPVPPTTTCSPSESEPTTEDTGTKDCTRWIGSTFGVAVFCVAIIFLFVLLLFFRCHKDSKRNASPSADLRTGEADHDTIRNTSVTEYMLSDEPIVTDVKARSFRSSVPHQRASSTSSMPLDED